jgi:hypothetical protein
VVVFFDGKCVKKRLRAITIGRLFRRIPRRNKKWRLKNGATITIHRRILEDASLRTGVNSSITIVILNSITIVNKITTFTIFF